MLSGSFAMLLYATPRMTRDIDIVINLQKEDIDSFLEIFVENFYYHKPSIIEEVNRKGMFNVIDHRSGYKVDFVIRKNDDYRLVEFSRKLFTDKFGFDAYVVTAEDLLLSKLIWIQGYQSKQQTEDIENILLSESIDKKYIQKWIDKLHLKTFELL